MRDKASRRKGKSKPGAVSGPFVPIGDVRPDVSFTDVQPFVKEEVAFSAEEVAFSAVKHAFDGLKGIGKLGSHGNLEDGDDTIGYSYPPIKGNAQDILQSCLDKFNSRQYYRVSRAEVYTWFKDMGFNIGDGSFTVHNVQAAIWMYFDDLDTQEHLQNILDQADASGDGVCDVDEFHQALRLGYNSGAVKKIVRGAEIPDANHLFVTRHTLIDYLGHKLELTASCSSLPYYIVVFFILFFMVLGHLQTASVYSMTNTMRGEVGGWLEDVGDWNNNLEDNYVTWLNSNVVEALNLSGDTCYMGIDTTSTLTTTGILCDQYYMRGRFLSNMQLTSGIKVMKIEAAPGKCKLSNYDSLYQGVTSVVYTYARSDTQKGSGSELEAGTCSPDYGTCFDAAQASCDTMVSCEGFHVTYDTYEKDTIGGSAAAGQWDRFDGGKWQTWEGGAAGVADNDHVFFARSSATTTAWPTQMCQSDEHMLAFSRELLEFSGDNYYVLSPTATDIELKKQVNDKQNEGWITNSNSLGFRVQLSFFNAQYNFFVNVLIIVARSGVGAPITPEVRVEAFKPDPYLEDYWYLVVLDCLWLLLVIYGLLFALWELKSECMVHILPVALWRYFDMWTIMDWFNLGMSSMLVTTYWNLVSESYTLIENLNTSTKVWDDTSLSMSERLTLGHANDEKNNSSSAKISAAYVSLKYWLCAYCVSAAFVFFKGFRANPKLNVVYITLQRAAPDLIHFGLVFLCVLLSFVLTGHVIMGQEVIAFAEWTDALSTEMFMCFGQAVDPYRDDMIDSNDGSPLGVIFLLLIILVMIILLMNMILAIIFDIYGDVKAETGDAASVFDQLFHEIAMRKKKFLAAQKVAMMHAGKGAGHSTALAKFSKGWVGFLLYQVKVILDSIKTALRKLIHGVGNVLHYMIVCIPGGRKLSEATAKVVYGLEKLQDRIQDTAENVVKRVDDVGQKALEKAEREAAARVKAGEEQQKLDKKKARMTEAELKAAGLDEGFDVRKDKGTTDFQGLLMDGTGLSDLTDLAGNIVDKTVDVAEKANKTAQDAAADTAKLGTGALKNVATGEVLKDIASGNIVGDLVDAVQDTATADNIGDMMGSGAGIGSAVAGELNFLTRDNSEEERTGVAAERDLPGEDIDIPLFGTDGEENELVRLQLAELEAESKASSKHDKKRKKWTTESLHFELEENDAHPSNMVTGETLMETFQDLDEVYAEFLVSNAEEYSRDEKMLAELNMEDMLRIACRCDSNLREAKSNYVYTTRRVDSTGMSKLDRARLLKEENCDIRRVSMKIRALKDSM